MAANFLLVCLTYRQCISNMRSSKFMASTVACCKLESVIFCNMNILGCQHNYCSLPTVIRTLTCLTESGCVVGRDQTVGRKLLIDLY